jgi:hypothetical protein
VSRDKTGQRQDRDDLVRQRAAAGEAEHGGCRRKAA